MQKIYSKNSYQVGGCLSGDAPSYVWREADNKLYQWLLKGEFCYVLNSRQMGKSSLRVQTMKRLKEAGVACAAIDVTTIGTHKITLEQWYGSLIKSLVNIFDLREKFVLRSWWEERNNLSPVQCFGEFIEEVLLREISQPIVIFLDEIDSTLQLEFKDDFFALIRDFYNKKAEEKSVYKRLTFVLLGVATPYDLIQDKTRTPFNLGRVVELQGFQLDEIVPLEAGIKGKVEDAKAVNREILAWTGGQPFLTQKLCQLVQNLDEEIATGQEKQSIAKLVQTKIIDDWERQDEPEHLRTIRKRILNDERQVGKLLEIYQKILQDKEIDADNSLEVMKLQLSGLVVKQDNQLKVYNPIYKTVFTQKWIDNELASLRPYAKKLSAWLASNRSDDSHLLDKQELHNAQEWAADKSLSSQDYQFLNASLDLERRKAEEEAEQILADAKKKAKRQNLLGTLLLIGATVVGGWATQQILNLRSQKYAELQKRISTGEDILLNSNLDKRGGAKQFAEGNFKLASQKFQKSRQNLLQDPESLIYWQNAKFAQSHPLTIAVGVPIGKNEAVAKEMLRGVAQAQQEINQDCQPQKIDKNCGIGGRPLQVQIVNDDNDPKIAKELASLLVKDSSIVAVVGHNASDVSRSAASIYQNQLVMISPTSFSMDFRKLEASSKNYIFRTVPGIRYIVKNLAQHISQEINQPKVLVCYDSDADDNNSFKKEFSKFKQTIEIADLDCDFSNPNLNYEEILKQAINKEVNSLLLAPHVDRINEAIKIAKINYAQKTSNRLNLFSSPSLYTSKTLEDEEGRKAVTGMQLAVAWHLDIDSDSGFITEAQKLWQSNLDHNIMTWRTAMAYDATQVIIQGLKKQQNPTRKGLKKILSSPDFSFYGATGKVKFQKGERIEQKAFLVEIKQKPNSETDFDFVPVPPH